MNILNKIIFFLKVINSNVSDNNMTLNNVEITKKNSIENDDGMFKQIDVFLLL